MKKILLASSALIATAGVAAAELNVTGSARFGLAYVEDATQNWTLGVSINETRIEQRMRVNFTGIAETDAGVKFEARIRLEANEDANSRSPAKARAQLASQCPPAASVWTLVTFPTCSTPATVETTTTVATALVSPASWNITQLFQRPVRLAASVQAAQDATTIKAKYWKLVT